MPDRVLSGASFIEIINRQRAVKTNLRAALYLYNNTKFIVTSISGIIETGEPTVLAEDAPTPCWAKPSAITSCVSIRKRREARRTTS
jgi:hypothetical protein